ncbi:MAG TPA: PQQ-binding-like beta-propeller repeat protein [Lacipirellulaceae bacterium]|nr:PQQ-binding-like beta-propeller repeat protein [Lacipirellulaceae bacterium]
MVLRGVLLLNGVTVVSLLLTTQTHAYDWPEFRGPSGQGEAVESDPPVEWTPTKNVAWRTPIPGSGWSSPIVFGDRIYLTTAIQELDDTELRQSPSVDFTDNTPTSRNTTDFNLSLRVLAVEKNYGHIVWEREVFSYAAGNYSPGHAKNGFASPTPTTDGKTVYVHFGPQGTAALDWDGNAIWRRRVDYEARHGAASSPVIAGNRLVLNCDGAEDPFVCALDPRTGEELWRTQRQPMDFEKFAFSTPLAIPSSSTASSVQLVSPGSHMVGSYDPADGRELWHVYFPRRWSAVSRPVYANGMVIICNGGERNPELIAIRPDGSGDVSNSHVVWRHNKCVPLTSSVVVVDDHVYMVSDGGIAACTEVGTGKLVWKKRLGGNFSASPVCAGGRLYFPSDAGICHVIAAEREFRELAKNDLGEPILASFAVDGNAFIIRTGDALYRVEERDPRFAP